MKKLTIITINFNNKEGLARTIDSIVNQTFTDYEWIVVDGGSTDGSRELLEQYKERFVWWCSERDKGVYNAMNKGISHATGEYINFMNSGDCFATPTVLEEIFSQPHDADIMYGVMAYETINGWRQNIPSIPPAIGWWEMFEQGVGHQSELAKRALFDEKNFDESYRIYADWDWNAYFISVRRVKTEFLPIIVSIYEGGGISATQMELVKKEKAIIQQRYFPALRSEDINELRYIAVLKRFKLSRLLYHVLSRATNRWVRIRKNRLNREIH